MQHKKVDNGFVIRLEKGEELFESLKKFCEERSIKSGWLIGLGGATRVKLSYYDLDKKRYIDKEFNELLEVTNVTGNIAELNGEIVMHIHGTFGRTDYSSLAAHVSSLTVAATLELFIRPFTEPLIRKKDEPTGLSLLDLDA